MTIAVDMGRKATQKKQKNKKQSPAISERFCPQSVNSRVIKLQLLSFENLFFVITVLSSILAKCVHDQVLVETFCQRLQNVLCLWRKQIFVYIDEDFAIN